MSIPVSSSAFRSARVELVLDREGGRPWRLSMSPGVERFIGAYARLEEFRTAGPLLTYVAEGAARV